MAPSILVCRGVGSSWTNFTCLGLSFLSTSPFSRLSRYGCRICMICLLRCGYSDSCLAADSSLLPPKCASNSSCVHRALESIICCTTASCCSACRSRSCRSLGVSPDSHSGHFPPPPPAPPPPSPSPSSPPADSLCCVWVSSAGVSLSAWLSPSPDAAAAADAGGGWDVSSFMCDPNGSCEALPYMKREGSQRASSGYTSLTSFWIGVPVRQRVRSVSMLPYITSNRCEPRPCLTFCTSSSTVMAKGICVSA
mmetsp:Transcript_42815/g.106983  ORF Transcript_42815/g.106983 Transcript_42815/m.106983 type:complete len:252 (+) Transcript_42815:2522-3277(+)